jgi:hypothetical protein
MGMELNLHKTLCHFLVAQLQVELRDPLSSGPITLEPNIKEALNGLIQENWADSKKTKMGSNNNQGLVHVIKAVGEVN